MSYSSQQNNGSNANNACFGARGSWGVREDGLHSLITHELARELNDLTVHERERVFEDIHGVAQAHEETPEFTHDRIQELDKAISEVPRARRKALDRAFFLRPSFRTGTKLKLMFLRADEYDPTKAANRMANFFIHKHRLFGEDKLGKTITLDDFDAEDMRAFAEAPMMESAGRDQVGRPIVFLDMGKSDWENPTSVNRAVWYQMMASVMDDEVGQKKGMVYIEYHHRNSPSMLLPRSTKRLEYMKKIGDIIASMPFRVSSLHQCFENPDDPHLKLLFLIRMVIGKEARLRMKVHFGSPIEIQYALLTYGICYNKSLLYRKNCNYNREVFFQSYIQNRLQCDRAIKQQEEEQQSRSGGVILYPGPNDVLMGRGTPYQEYVGNLRWGRLVDSRVSVYRQCKDDNFAKTCVSMDAIKTVQEYGGRFIQQTSEGWKVVGNDMARKKSASAFRTRAQQGKNKMIL